MAADEKHYLQKENASADGGMLHEADSVTGYIKDPGLAAKSLAQSPEGRLIGLQTSGLGSLNDTEALKHLSSLEINGEELSEFEKDYLEDFVARSAEDDLLVSHGQKSAESLFASDLLVGNGEEGFADFSTDESLLAHAGKSFGSKIKGSVAAVGQAFKYHTINSFTKGFSESAHGGNTNRDDYLNPYYDAKDQVKTGVQLQGIHYKKAHQNAVNKAAKYQRKLNILRRKQATAEGGKRWASNKWYKKHQERKAKKLEKKISKSLTKISKTRWGWLVKLGGAALVASLVMLLVVIALTILMAIAGSQAKDDSPGLDGLPPYITSEMIEAALECQETYKHPAGATLAQIIAESGMGDHMSKLATQDKNLFGMKYVSSQSAHPEVAGYSEWATTEYYDGSTPTQITARFTKFVSYRDCIIFRSRVFLQYSIYTSNPDIQAALDQCSSDLMAKGLAKDWATSAAYETSLKSIMATYNLYRFDGMTIEQYRKLKNSESGSGSGNGQDYASATAKQKAVVDSCNRTASPGSGWCAMWVSMVFQNAGFGYPAGDACDMYWNWCWSTNRSDLKIGMVVAVPSSSSGTSLGARYGHIGIYVGRDTFGNELVMHNAGTIRTDTLDDWIATYGKFSTTKWGYIYNLD